MKIVLDASAACELVLSRPLAKKIDSLIRNAEKVSAPELFVAEVANTLWKYVKAREIDLDRSQKYLEASIQLCDGIEPMASLIQEALMTASVTKHSVYDMIYLILARRNGAHLISLDKKLLQIARENGVVCAEL